MSATKFVIDSINDFTTVAASSAVGSATTTTSLFQNHLLAGHVQEMLQNNAPTIVPVWAITDASLGLINEIIAVVNSVSAIKRRRLEDAAVAAHLLGQDDTVVLEQDDTDELEFQDDDLSYGPEIKNLLASSVKIGANANLLYQGIHALVSHASIALNPAIFAGFAIKYGIEWIEAGRKLSNIPSDKIHEIAKARMEFVTKGLYFAGFLAVTLGAPTLGLVILASCAFLRLAMKACSTKQPRAGFWRHEASYGNRACQSTEEESSSSYQPMRGTS